MTIPKFNVGDFVYWRQEYEHWLRHSEPLLKKSRVEQYISMGDLELRLRYPGKLQIVEVVTTTCHGGTQIFYELRKPDGTLFRLTEPEVTTDELPA